uniref:Putative secreted protein n=1 Tax=Anopheles darlingi TaxID=43151 RepID=A0A2M4D7Z0_ANODA
MLLIKRSIACFDSFLVLSFLQPCGRALFGWLSPLSSSDCWRCAGVVWCGVPIPHTVQGYIVEDTHKAESGRARRCQAKGSRTQSLSVREPSKQRRR